MNAADKLRAELANTNEQIIKNELMPRREEILRVVTEGIKRIGYVTLDTFDHYRSSAEGNQIGVHDNKKLEALKEFLTKEGFKASFYWWGYSSDGLPDGIKIRL